MEPEVARQLGMEGRGPDRPSRTSTGRPSWRARTSTPAPVRSITGARMNPREAAGEPVDVELRLEALALAA